MNNNAINQKRSKKASSLTLAKHVSAHHLVKKPVMSEKAYALSWTLNQYVFFVDARATKNDIKKSFVELYGKTPVSVNTVSTPAKFHQSRQIKKTGKKAIITLAKDDKLDLL